MKPLFACCSSTSSTNSDCSHRSKMFKFGKLFGSKSSKSSTTSAPNHKPSSLDSTTMAMVTGIASRSRSDSKQMDLLLHLPDDLSQRFATLLENEWHSDLTLVLDDDGGDCFRFRVHRNVLAISSPVFADLLKDKQQQPKGELKVEAIKPQVMQVLLTFFYTGRVCVDQCSVQLASGLLLAADKYQVEPLKEVCANWLGGHLELESVCGVLLMADRMQLAELRASCLHYIVAHHSEVTAHEHWTTRVMAAPNVVQLMGDLLKVSVQRQEVSVPSGAESSPTSPTVPSGQEQQDALNED